MLTVKVKEDTSRVYPGLTAEAVREREAALDRFARWQAHHHGDLAPEAAVAAVAELYELLPAASRFRAPDPSGVVAFHTFLLRTRSAAL
jgi:hypothetical protein